MVSKKSIQVWGPAMWDTLHVIAHTSPLKLSAAERERMRTLLRSIAAHLPCPRCRAHFEDFLERRMDEDALASRVALVSLLNDAHNEVNVRCGKRKWSLDEHYRAYTRSTTLAAFDTGSFALGILCVLLATCVFVRRQRRRIVMHRTTR